jgi:Zn-dependent M28 family amino/carboxypeptidase
MNPLRSLCEQVLTVSPIIGMAMRMNFIKKEALVLLLLFNSCIVYGQSTSSKIFNKERFVESIKTLSSDEFQGRKPGTIGEKKTIQYLTQRFLAAGVSPGNGDSYFQQVPLLDILPIRDSVMVVTAKQESFVLKDLKDYIVWTEKPVSELSFKDDELVFAGYGITAPEYNWDDYAGVDVKGKIVLAFAYEPNVVVDGKPLFKGDEVTWYGMFRYKLQEAARRGAKGCILINDSVNTSSFKVKVASFSKDAMAFDYYGSERKVCDIVGFLPESVGERIFVAAGRGKEMKQQASVPGFKGFPLGVKLSFTLRTRITRIISNNVIAKIRGSKRPDETIVFTAHWDHLGIGPPDNKGDSIYNGAADNATGVSALLELANAFASLDRKPERTIVFLVTTAEELGMLGSQWYVTNPIYPLRRTVANFNFDGAQIFGRTKDISLAGIGQNDLEDMLHQLAVLESRYVNFERKDSEGLFYRSDQLPFAAAGVPVLFQNYGHDFFEKDKAQYWEKAMEAQKKNRYHRPSDEFNDAWDIDGALRNLALIFTLSNSLASSEVWPLWKAGSEFKAIREGSQKVGK